MTNILAISHTFIPSVLMCGHKQLEYLKDKKDIEILLIQDSKERWTIPKGHIEPGETAKVTARREI